MSPRGHVSRQILRASACILLGLTGCGSQQPTPPPPAPDLSSLLDAGWAQYRSARYDSAAATFLRATADFDSSSEAWLGRGWTAARRDSLEEADRCARASLERRPTADARAAVAVVAAAAGRDSVALWALGPAIPLAYVFHRDERLTGRDLCLIEATALYHLRRYPECLEAILRLDPEVGIDLSAYDFREQLGHALQELGL